jgi:PAS domain S-box-containing protein
MLRADSALLHLAAAVHYIDAAIISEDLMGAIESWNPAAERMFGFGTHEVIGQPLRIILPADRQSEHERLRARFRKGEVVDNFETVRQRRDGTTFPVALTISPIRDEDGTIIGAANIVRDITERKRNEHEALLLSSVVASSNDAIISKDLNGVVTSWNQAAERLFGFTAAEAIGKTLTALIIPSERRSEEDEVLARIRAGRSIHHFETVRQRKDRSRLEVSLTVSPVKNRLGEIIGASKIARDMSERNRLIRELEQASRMKDEFLATLSHELRTPLNAIMGYARILKERVDDERTRRAAEVIERNGHMLAQLVGDVLDMSAVAAGKTRLKIQSVDLVAVLDEALAVVGPAAAAKHLTLAREFETPTCEISGDPRRLQQVFWNLLANAVKFTPKGGSVRVHMARDPDAVTVMVADTGVGIDPAFLPKVFQRFSQADSGAARAYGGIGLGLSLVRHFVELHGGIARAHSDGLNRGATFEIVLPCRSTSLDA